MKKNINQKIVLFVLLFSFSFNFSFALQVEVNEESKTQKEAVEEVLDNVTVEAKEVAIGVAKDTIEDSVEIVEKTVKNTLNKSIGVVTGDSGSSVPNDIMSSLKTDESNLKILPFAGGEEDGTGKKGGYLIEKTIPNIIKVFTMIAGGLAFLMFLYAGSMMIIFGDNEDKLGNAKKTLLWTVIGMVVAGMAYSIVSGIISLPGL